MDSPKRILFFGDSLSLLAFQAVVAELPMITLQVGEEESAADLQRLMVMFRPHLLVADEAIRSVNLQELAALAAAALLVIAPDQSLIPTQGGPVQKPGSQAELQTLLNTLMSAPA